VRRPSKVAITVEDGCGGANLTALERLIAQPNGTRPDGAGLGLAIAKGLIEVQGGRLTVTRAPRGCQFAIELPLVRSLAGVGLPHSPPLLNRGVPVRRARSPLRPARTKGPCDRA
jgi:nitrogen-specific signal transduction histidine kinase